MPAYNPNPLGQLGPGQGFLSRPAWAAPGVNPSPTPAYPGWGGTTTAPAYTTYPSQGQAEASMSLAPTPNTYRGALAGLGNPGLAPPADYTRAGMDASLAAQGVQGTSMPGRFGLTPEQAAQYASGQMGFPVPQGASQQTTTGGGIQMTSAALMPSPETTAGNTLNYYEQMKLAYPHLASQIDLIQQANLQSGQAYAQNRLMGMEQVSPGTYAYPSGGVPPGQRPPAEPPPPQGGGGQPPPAGGGGGVPPATPPAGAAGNITPELIRDLLTNPRFSFQQSQWADNPQGLVEELYKWNELSPGIAFGPTGMPVEPDAADRRGLLNKQRAGIYSQDPYQLPGGAEAAYELLNLMENEALLGSRRANEAESLMRQYVSGAAGSSANLLNEKILGDLRADPYTTSSPQLQKRMEDRAIREIEGGRSIAAQRMQDAGLYGMGPAGADALGALDESATNQRYNAMLDIAMQMAQNRAGDIKAGQEASMRGADVFHSLQGNPSLQLMNLLRSARNPALSPYADVLANVANAQIAKEWEENRGQTVFERIAPVLGAGIGAAGNIFGGNALTSALQSLTSALGPSMGTQTANYFVP